MSIATVVTRGYGSFGSITAVVLRGYSIGATPPVPPGPATQTSGFDAGPAFGKWFNLAYRAGSRRKRRPDVVAVEPETPEEITEAAIERIAEVEPRDEGAAWEAVQELLDRYQAQMEGEQLYRARLAFADAIVAAARDEIAQQERAAEEDEFVLMVAGGAW